jgi:hypothetical protein
MFLPIIEIEISVWILVIIGFCVGVLGGFFGIGGAFIVTPALNIYGFPMAYAIGTDLAHIMGKSIIATIKHRKMGNVDIRLGAMMFLGTIVGVEIGKEMILYLEAIDRVGTLVRAIYVLLLGGIGGYMIFDYLRFSKELEGRGEHMVEKIGTSLSKMLQGINLPPKVSLPASGIRSISIWAILIVGLLTGFLTSFLGVGGGFIRMPALIYAIGVPTTVAIGTDLFEIIFSSGIGTFLYALEGRVELVAAMIMLAGAAIGTQIGTTATQYIRGMKIRLYFALTVLIGGISVAIKQVSVTYSIPELGSLAGYIIIFAAALMSLNIIFILAKGLLEERNASL